MSVFQALCNLDQLQSKTNLKSTLFYLNSLLKINELTPISQAKSWNSNHWLIILNLFILYVIFSIGKFLEKKLAGDEVKLMTTCVIVSSVIC